MRVRQIISFTEKENNMYSTVAKKYEIKNPFLSSFDKNKYLKAIRTDVLNTHTLSETRHRTTTPCVRLNQGEEGAGDRPRKRANDDDEEEAEDGQ